MLREGGRANEIEDVFSMWFCKRCGNVWTGCAKSCGYLLVEVLDISNEPSIAGSKNDDSRV